MKNPVLLASAALAIPLLVVVGCLLGTAGGCFVGWLVGAVWPHTMAILLAKLGLVSVKMWQLGAMLGFVSGFFRDSVTVKASSD